MDIYCANCAEPQDAFDLGLRERTLLKRGMCSYCMGRVSQRTVGADMRTALFDILGDDLDGVASIMDGDPCMGLFDIQD
jgi:hypothetical protein